MAVGVLCSNDAGHQVQPVVVEEPQAVLVAPGATKAARWLHRLVADALLRLGQPVEVAQRQQEVGAQRRPCLEGIEGRVRVVEEGPLPGQAPSVSSMD